MSQHYCAQTPLENLVPMKTGKDIHLSEHIIRVQLNFMTVKGGTTKFKDGLSMRQEVRRSEKQK